MSRPSLSVEAVGFVLRDLAPSFLYSKTEGGEVLIESKQSEGRLIVEDVMCATRLLKLAGFSAFATAPKIYVSEGANR